MRLTVTSVEDFVLILNGKQPSVNLVTRSMIRSNDGALRYLGEKCTKLRRKVLYMGVRLDTRPSDSLIACGKKCSGQRTNNSFARNRSLNGKCDRFIKIGSSPLDGSALSVHWRCTSNSRFKGRRHKAPQTVQV